MHKIGILGGGNVGAAAAFTAATRDLGKVAIYDIQAGMPNGKALDMLQSGPVLGFDSMIRGSNDPEILVRSDVVIVTAGFPRKPGMTRMDLLRKNKEIAESAGDIIKMHAPNAVVICVTNPLDVMTWVVQQATGFPKERVIGMAGMLDSARFATFIAMEVECSPKDVRAMVLGGHGVSMVPLPRFSTVNGVPITELLPEERIASMVERTANGGAEIVKLLGTGSAHYTPGAAAVLMAEAVLDDTGRIVPSSTWAEGYYGLGETYCGLPIQLGDGGVRRVVELDLNEKELEALHASAKTVEEGIAEVKALDD